MNWNARQRLSNVPYIDVRPEDDTITAAKKTLAVLEKYNREKAQKARLDAERSALAGTSKERSFFGRMFG